MKQSSMWFKNTHAIFHRNFESRRGYKHLFSIVIATECLTTKIRNLSENLEKIKKILLKCFHTNQRKIY